MKRLTSSLLLLLVSLSLVFSLFACKDDERESYSLDDIPVYSGAAYVPINGNVPFFTDDEISVRALEEYSSLDPLGRCGVAIACIGTETMPEDKREEIGSVSPSGWYYNKVSNNNKYDFVDGGFLYNRCHLIGFQLAGENANEKNLITGTRYLNIEGMLPFENQIAAYVKATGNHVLYRVTPIYNDMDLVASGVLMEGISIEDDGEGIKFCVYAFNVQPGVTINYFTGQNAPSGEELPPVENTPNEENDYYIINVKSKTIHKSDCGSAATISESNRQEFRGDEEILLEEFKGYKGCGSCLPDLVIPEETPEDVPEDNEGDTVPPKGDADNTEVTYVLNTNTKKYHLPTCRNVPTKEENRLDYHGTLEELLAEYEDYSGCGTCKPDEAAEE